MYLKEIRFFMARAYGPGSYDPKYEEQGHDYPFAYVRWTENRNMEEFLRLVALGRVRLAPMITHRFPLEDAARAYQTILDPASASLAVVLDYPAAATPDPVAGYTPKKRVATAASTEPQFSAATGSIGRSLGRGRKPRPLGPPSGTQEGSRCETARCLFIKRRAWQELCSAIRRRLLYSRVRRGAQGSACDT